MMNQEQVLRTLREKISEDAPNRQVLVSPSEGELFKSLATTKAVIARAIAQPQPQASFFVKLYVLLVSEEDSEEMKRFYSNSMLEAEQIPGWAISLIAEQKSETAGFAVLIASTDPEGELFTEAFVFCE